MKKKYKIEIAYNPEIFVHSTKRIIACYSKEYFEVNEKYEKMSFDEIKKIMDKEQVPQDLRKILLVILLKKIRRK